MGSDGMGQQKNLLGQYTIGVCLVGVATGIIHSNRRHLDAVCHLDRIRCLGVFHTETDGCDSGTAITDDTEVGQLEILVAQ